MLSLKQVVYLAIFLLGAVSGKEETRHRNCFQNFNRKIQKCLEPFSKLFKTYQQTQDETMFSSIVKKHICFEYEKMLLCMHSTLTHCPTLRNIKRVQEKLGADWVNDVNGLCRIPPTPKPEEQIKKHRHSHRARENSVETNSVEKINRGGLATNTNQIPPIWEVIESEDEILKKKEYQMWQTLKINLQQKVNNIKKKLRQAKTNVEDKGATYNVYNIFYNTNNRQSVPIIAAAQMSYSSAGIMAYHSLVTAGSVVVAITIGQFR